MCILRAGEDTTRSFPAMEPASLASGIPPWFSLIIIRVYNGYVCPSQKLYVVLSGKWFEIALHKDESWNEMIEYGVNHAKVERRFLESIPLHI